MFQIFIVNNEELGDRLFRVVIAYISLIIVKTIFESIGVRLFRIICTYDFKLGSCYWNSWIDYNKGKTRLKCRLSVYSYLGTAMDSVRIYVLSYLDHHWDTVINGTFRVDINTFQVPHSSMRKGTLQADSRTKLSMKRPVWIRCLYIFPTLTSESFKLIWDSDLEDGCAHPSCCLFTRSHCRFCMDQLQIDAHLWIPGEKFLMFADVEKYWE